MKKPIIYASELSPEYLASFNHLAVIWVHGETGINDFYNMMDGCPI